MILESRDSGSFLYMKVLLLGELGSLMYSCSLYWAPARDVPTFFDTYSLFTAVVFPSVRVIEVY